MSRFRVVFRDRNFVCFWFGQLISQFGDRLNQMALISLVHKGFGGSAFALAKVMSLTIIPAFIFSPVAGVFVDRWNRRTTMIVTDLIRAMLVVLIPLSFWLTDSFLPVYFLIFCVFTTSCFFLPSKFSFIPELVSSEKLLLVNSLTNTSMMFAAVLGIGLGGPLIESVGSGVGFGIDALTYGVSAILLLLVRPLRPTGTQGRAVSMSELSAKGHSIAQDIRQGFLYVYRHRGIRGMFGVIFLLMSAGGALYSVGVVFIQKTFGTVTSDLGILSIVLGAGFTLGALLCGRYAQKIKRVTIVLAGMLFSGIILSLFVFVLSQYRSWRLSAIMCFLLGVVVGPVFIASSTYIHEVITEQFRGRVFSALGMVMNIGFLFTLLLGSKVSEHTGEAAVLYMVGAALGCAGGLGLGIRRVFRHRSVIT